MSCRDVLGAGWVPAVRFRQRVLDAVVDAANGSAGVRHHRGAFAVDGNDPLCHLRADRSLIPAAAAAAPSVLPAIRFSRNRRTWASVTNPSSARKTGSVTRLAAATATDRSPPWQPAKIIVVDHPITLRRFDRSRPTPELTAKVTAYGTNANVIPERGRTRKPRVSKEQRQTVRRRTPPDAPQSSY